MIYDELFGSMDPESKRAGATGAAGGKKGKKGGKVQLAKNKMKSVFAGVAEKNKMEDSSSEEEEEDEDELESYGEMVAESMARMRRGGVKIIPVHQLYFGADLDSGSFGVVREARWVASGKETAVRRPLSISSLSLRRSRTVLYSVGVFLLLPTPAAALRPCILLFVFGAAAHGNHLPYDSSAHVFRCLRG